ncbi:MAG: hypothetical protein Q9169_006464 [Polycauliona sp. 2 TL-2023]
MTPLHLSLTLLIIISTTLTTALIPRSPQTSPTPQNWEVVKFGRYNIVGCSSQNTETLQTLLSTLQTIIQPAIQDADSSLTATTPSPAFSTFFHNPLIAASTVSRILTDISTGRSAYPPSDALLRSNGLHPLVNGNPTFICITEPGLNLGRSDGPEPDLDGYDLCQKDGPALVMDHFVETQYINVCPSFFTIGIPPLPPKNHCLRVNRILNRFQGSGAVMSHFQIWVLLEEIVGYYMGGWKGVGVKDFGYYEGRGEGISHINDCMALPAKKAIRNEMSFVYYVASLYGNCTAFPNPNLSNSELK